MGTYGLEQVMRMWELGKLTAEQAIGQILQLMREDRERMNEIERRLKKADYSPRSTAEGEGRDHAPQARPASSAARNEPDELYSWWVYFILGASPALNRRTWPQHLQTSA